MLAAGVVSGALDELRARLAADGPADDVLAATFTWLLRSTPSEAAHLVAAVAAGCADIVDGPACRGGALDRAPRRIALP